MNVNMQTYDFKSINRSSKIPMVIPRYRSEFWKQPFILKLCLRNASFCAGTEPELSTSADPKGGLRTVHNEAKWPTLVMNFSSLCLRHLLFVRILRNHPGALHTHNKRSIWLPSNSLTLAVVRDRQINKLRERKKYRKINLLLLNYFPHAAAHELKRRVSY